MKRLFQAAIALSAALLLSACATGRLHIPPDLSPAELIQRAQEASDRNRFGHALQFYHALLERFAHEPALVVNAEYEIGFIHERRRDFDEARLWLNSVLARYYGPGGDALPAKFRVLARVVLDRIDERENNQWRRRR